ncbi:MAG: helix-turn-helix domain-containing protein [Candidatus Eremiobacteraeota bacterium]|nr:helix-turn-helix domain-containing protein [Candidatus Eremiobacteraeota bacterium]
MPADSSRRRTPGLRRSEAAQLAGVSTEWYTLFEMGRERAMTARAIDSVARALRLTETEHDYLRDLVRPKPPSKPLLDLPPALDVALKTDRDKLLVVYDRWLNEVRWNVVAAAFLRIDASDASKRNMLWRLFCAPETREIFVQWDHFSALFLGLFRRSLGRDPANAEARRLIAAVSVSADFREMWKKHELWSLADEAHSSMNNVYCLRHPRVGELCGYCIGLEIPGSMGAHVRVGVPADAAGRRMIEDIIASLGFA